MKRTASTLALLTVVVALAGCSSSPSAENWKTPEVPKELSSALSMGSLPFDSYATSSAERQQLQVGTASLLARCLSEYGISATFAGDYIQQVSTEPGSPLIFQWGGRLGTLTLDQASQFGYAAPPGGEWVNGSGIYLSSPGNLFPIPPEDATHAAQLAAALYGPDQAAGVGEGGAEVELSPELVPRDQSGQAPQKGGCYGVVEDEIGIPLLDLRDIESDTYGLTFSHEAVKDVASLWSECMKDEGYEYARFEEAPEANAGAINDETIAAATADVACTASSRWPDTFYFVLADYQQQAIDKQPELFQSALDAERRRLEKINTLIGE